MSKFRKWLYENGMLIKDFCATIHVHYTIVYKWRIKQVTPSAPNMHKIKILTKGVIAKPQDLWDETPAPGP